ncbi:hypothetical protein CHS0354_008474 [Potamilus streckersoni]|uniref:Uncharacterized protein n=1 Tax=Potamilus streckersoni TaxID=2493646 RepID=A0AAE0RPR7_9BIVA|nr:hypothetical protein CHS0354_008474 [Potamilus streckersoni]
MTILTIGISLVDKVTYHYYVPLLAKFPVHFLRILTGDKFVATESNNNAPNWNAWTTCSKSCDKGSKLRFRKCDNPVPRNNGSTCQGHAMDIADCLLRHCPAERHLDFRLLLYNNESAWNRQTQIYITWTPRFIFLVPNENDRSRQTPRFILLVPNNKNDRRKIDT